MKLIRTTGVICLFVAIFSFFLTGLWGAGENSPGKALPDNATKDSAVKKEDELARVSIIPFEDRTNSVYFQYMAESLGDAINTSMLKDFSYNRVVTAEVKKAEYDAVQEIIKENIKNKDKAKDKPPVKPVAEKPPGQPPKDVKTGDKNPKPVEGEDIKVEVTKEKTPEQLQKDAEQLELVKRIARKTSSDIAIYGNYYYDNETNELVFTVTLYLALSDSVKELEETRNVVDNTLFRATQKVAKSLVNEIHLMIEEAEKIASLKKGEKVDEKKDAPVVKPGTKIALTKKVAMSDELEWIVKKFSIGLSPGFFINLPPEKGTTGICAICQAQVALNARFWVLPGLYLGAKLDFGEIWSPTTSFGSSMALDGFAFIGYGLPTGRWLFAADAGAGYFLISDKRFGLAYNPAFFARLGVEFLVTGSFSVGLSANGLYYYDKPRSLIFGGLSLALNYVL